MAIRLTERSAPFHVPFETPNSDGTPEVAFIDLKANPEWIPVLPSCIGWPDTQDLLRLINGHASPFMSLAAGQTFTTPKEPPSTDRQVNLVSFVTVCFAERTDEKASMLNFREFLRCDLEQSFQTACNVLKRPLHIHLMLELHPTIFHIERKTRWSLSIFMNAMGENEGKALGTWRIGMMALREVLARYINRE